MFFKKLNPVFILKLKRIICWSCYPILVLSFLNSCKDQEDYIEEVYDYEAFEVTVFEQLENDHVEAPSWTMC